MKYKLGLLLLNLAFFSLVLDVDSPNLWLMSIFIMVPCLFIFFCTKNNIYKVLATLLVINFQYKQVKGNYVDNAHSYQGFLFSQQTIHELYSKNTRFEPIKSLSEITNDYSRSHLEDILTWDLVNSESKESKLYSFFSSLKPEGLDEYQTLVINKVRDNDLSILYDTFCSRLKRNSEVNIQALQLALTRYFNEKNVCHLSLKKFLEDQPNVSKI